MTIATAAAAEHEADRIRNDLALTIEQLKTNLTPSSLAGEAIAATRARTPAWLGEYWALARSPTGLAIMGAASTALAVSLVARNRGLRMRRRP